MRLFACIIQKSWITQSGVFRGEKALDACFNGMTVYKMLLWRYKISPGQSKAIPGSRGHVSQAVVVIGDKQVCSTTIMGLPNLGTLSDTWYVKSKSEHMCFGEAIVIHMMFASCWGGVGSTDSNSDYGWFEQIVWAFVPFDQTRKIEAAYCRITLLSAWRMSKFTMMRRTKHCDCACVSVEIHRSMMTVYMSLWRYTKHLPVHHQWYPSAEEMLVNTSRSSVTNKAFLLRTWANQFSYSRTGNYWVLLILNHHNLIIVSRNW